MNETALATVTAARGHPRRGPCDPACVTDPIPELLPDAEAVKPPLAPGEPDLPGPFPVGEYAPKLRNFLRGVARVRVSGEVTNLRASARAKGIYFDLRDANGALPCSMWRSDFDRLDLPEGTLRDGVEMVVAGGLDYFPGSERSSPSFSFRVTYMRPAGEGDLLAQLDRLRKQLAAEGLFEPQKQLHRPVLPRTIGVVVGHDSAALGDVLAGLERRSWHGRLVLVHPPVQGKAAAPRIASALRRLAEIPEVETIIVTRGGGSLTDLWCFCDEALCRTVALLRVPVISAVGHNVDRTLIDDVSAQCCSTPTHAAEAAVRVDVAVARGELGVHAASVGRFGRRAVAVRARALGADARSLAGHMRAERSRLHQLIREIRAASARALGGRQAKVGTYGLVLARRREATLVQTGTEGRKLARTAAGLERRVGAADAQRRQRLAALAATLSAHDPERVLERGYAIVSADRGPGGEGEPEVLTSAAAARERRRLRVRFADDDVAAEVTDDG